MPKTPEALINPRILTWARETVGFSPDDLAVKIKVPVNTLLAWEAGSERPSVAKLKAIADQLKRPLAVFFLPETPQDRRPPKDFRGLLEGHAGFFSPRLSVELRLAEARRQDALNLLEELEEEATEFTFTASLDEHPETVAERLAQFLGMDRFILSRCRDAYQALKHWKAVVEDHGILVFQATGVALSEMRGFSIGAFPLPVAVVNSKDSPNGKMFSLLHEVTHLALRQDGICDFNEDYPRDQYAQQIEVFCNHVAGAALVPTEQLLNQDIVIANSGNLTWRADQLKELANHFHCSREVVLRRLLIHGLTTVEFYNQKRREFLQEYKAMENNGDGFPVKQYIKAINRNGYFFSRLALDSYQRDIITGPELSKLLNIKLKHLGDLSQALGV